MFWIIVIIIVALIAVSLESILGKIVFGAGGVAIGCLLLRWITGLALFVTLAKVCAIIMVVTIVAALLIAIFN